MKTIFYLYSFLCDPLEDLYTEVEVLSVIGLEELWAPLISPFQKLAKSIQELPSRGGDLCRVLELANKGFQIFCICLC